jgi:hypothetical protein
MEKGSSPQGERAVGESCPRLTLSFVPPPFPLRRAVLLLIFFLSFSPSFFIVREPHHTAPRAAYKCTL